MGFDDMRGQVLKYLNDAGVLAADGYPALQSADWAPYGAAAVSLLLITFALGALVRRGDRVSAEQRAKDPAA